ncbi:hypothetical protein QR97_02100 [Streptomyces sp. PBH53]|uniref:hypothetical protein n=1 Tax=Streptomyces sp. PBH53 TaxID=1577075 RepID=UPI000655B5ED|nr:hypothetical protein [Streptomyces sp. PBH53]AKN68754.1 hypothetical protein QR97_02100 [Streptomyces sp. PBH53]
MTRYGIAIKALPKGGKPFGDDDEDQDKEPAAADGADAGTPAGDSPASTEPTRIPGEEALGPAASSTEEAPGEALPGEGAASAEGAEAPDGEATTGPAPAPEDDARPWSGDMYDEGDESDPADAFAAYKGGNGEEAWLDQATDGTLTGWVCDATGQVWRYSDPDVWAMDVDDAQMTRTHSQASSGGQPPGEHGGQDPLFPPQDQS